MSLNRKETETSMTYALRGISLFLSAACVIVNPQHLLFLERIFKKSSDTDFCLKITIL